MFTGYPGITQGVTELRRASTALWWLMTPGAASRGWHALDGYPTVNGSVIGVWIVAQCGTTRPWGSGDVGGEQARLDGVLVEVWGHVSRPPRPAEPSEILVHGALVQPERPAISRWLRPGSNARRKASNISRMGSRSAGTASLRMEVPEKECRR